MNFLRAFRPIALDLLATIVFAGLYWATGNIILATSVGIAAGIARFAYMKLRNQPTGPLQYLSVVLVIASGVTTVITNDPHFVQLKGSIIATAVGIVMLRTNWMAPYLPPIVTENIAPRVILWTSHGWGVLQIVLAAANAGVALAFTFNQWALYTSIVPAVAQTAAFVIQYLLFRTLVRRSVRARLATQTAAA
jgi:intracellular septation protein